MVEPWPNGWREASMTYRESLRPAAAETGSRPDLQLVLVSFTALFLELMVIRWVPGSVRVVSYYANLMLISSFLGLGLGAIASSRRLRTDRWFPVFLIVLILIVYFLRGSDLPGSTSEYRFFLGDPTFAKYGALVLLFLANALLFVPLGERIGKLFSVLPPLRAYGYDLVGSLLGTVCFGFFAYRYFSPAIGMVSAVGLWVAAVVLLGSSHSRAFTLFSAALSMIAISAFSRVEAIWSPYHYITVRPFLAGATRADDPSLDLTVVKDPPMYQLSVNHDFYQLHGSIDLRRYTPGTGLENVARNLQNQYLLPYAVAQRADNVLVVGAGGGMDVEAAHLAGARSVDAVEIDPVVLHLSHRFNAADPYHASNTTVHNDDARAFFERSTELYDVIVFGFLDSQALFSSMSNIRLDGFVYTVESLRRAYEHLNDDGLLSLSFTTANQEWVIQKIAHMIDTATGRLPFVYANSGAHIFLVPKGDHRAAPDRLGPFVRIETPAASSPPPATDDWPYLYLTHPAIPRDYLIVIGILTFLSLVGVMAVKPKGMGVEGFHFLFLGFGFLLLETSSIIACSLYFGTTWFVTMVVVAGVLGMVLAANLVVLRFRPKRLGWYLPLFIALALIFLVPRAWVLELPFNGRIAWTLLAVPLPIFFAGIVFSMSFREATNPPAMFGANLIGSTLGGFTEYAGMMIGHAQITWIVFAAYAASLACLIAHRARRFS